jgi:hypothetical protein
MWDAQAEIEKGPLNSNAHWSQKKVDEDGWLREIAVGSRGLSSRNL